MNELDHFITDLYRQDAATNTVQAYAGDIRVFAQWFAQTNGEPMTAAVVAPIDIRDYKAFLILRGTKAATINRKLSSLKKFFAWAQANKVCADLPTSAIKSIGTTDRAPKSLDKRAADRIIRVAERRGKKRDIAILMTLRHTGVRVSELAALRLSDVSISERAGNLMVRSGKGNKQRTIPLNMDVRHAIAAYLEVRGQFEDDHLFMSQERNPVATRTVWALIKMYGYHAGFPEVSPHTFRHTFAKELLDAGVDLVTVAELLGHSRLDTTAIYTRPSEQDLERAVEKLSWA